MINQPNPAEEHGLRLVSQPDETPQDLTMAEARVALEAVQRLNAKLETENASLREQVELLDQLVVKLLKRNDRLANKL